jgi:hypothetical protein
MEEDVILKISKKFCPSSLLKRAKRWDRIFQNEKVLKID